MPKKKRGGKRTGGTPQTAGTITINGETIEFDGDLEYGSLQAMSSQQRSAIDSWENKRYGNKIEFAIAIDADGRPLSSEARGGSGSVRSPRWWGDSPTAIFTHNHPRKEGELGGTLSKQDLYNWMNGNNIGKRATAKEGTYWITKGPQFDRAGFSAYIKQTWEKNNDQLKAYRKQLNQDASDNKISQAEYDRKYQKSFNNYLVGLHKDLLAGQKQYGYSYGLEKRRK